ncbi:single-stranded-DNA-specific exonuclease RecJ, partial [Candidatus Woesebacteria bacterium GWB1_43_5]
YGDYDADGICATAVLWEALYALGADITPYIPERFSEGYGLNAKSVQSLKLKTKNLKLIITVDNGIVANEGVKTAKRLGIDVIITDHHQKSNPPAVGPKAHSIIHTTATSGSGLAWFLARELGKNGGLELVAIGTIADQVPLLGVNRSLVKWGIEELNGTQRSGLLALFEEAAVKRGTVTPYTVGFIIAPRINAMGRLAHGLDSLRLLCTKNSSRALELAAVVGKTNEERQRIVEEVVVHARQSVLSNGESGIIVIAHKSYHEGVIGLAASKLVEEFWRPAIVISLGKSVAKASARSIPGVSIIEVIRKTGDLLVSGGGHEMAAGFSLETVKLDLFLQKLKELSGQYLTADLLLKTLKIDLELDFSQINQDLYKMLRKFEPVGMGNPAPTFVSKKVKVDNAKVVGADGKHLKLKLSQKNKSFSAIAFGMGGIYSQLNHESPIDVVYCVEEDSWNGNRGLQLKVKDLVILS